MSDQQSDRDDPSANATRRSYSQSPDAQAAPQRGRKNGTDVKSYYDSISDAFRETICSQKKDRSKDWLKFIVTTLFGLSLIPLVPYVFSFVIPRLLPGARLWIFGFKFSVASFWFWWPVCFVSFLLIVIIVFRLLRPTQKLLSQAQMRFGYAYGGGVEIRRYKTNHLQRHIQTATEYLGELPRMLPVARTSFRADFDPYPHFEADVVLVEAPYAEMDSFAEPRSRRPYWYRLGPETEKILSALRSFWPKLRDRLKDHKDLTAIESAVGDLANYLYTEIPEISEGTAEDRQRLLRFSMDSLNSFAEKINALEVYRSESPPSSREEKVSRGVVSTGQRLNAFFLHPNIAVSFLAWLILTS